MKRAVGIHFGHDAGIAVVSEAGIERFISKERLTRFKHAAGWDSATLAIVLNANPGAAVGISVTQGAVEGGGMGVAIGPVGEFSITSQSPRFWTGTVDLAEALRANPWLHWANSTGSHFAFKVNDEWGSVVRQRGNVRYSAGMQKLASGSYRKQDIPAYFDFHNSPEIGSDVCAVHTRESRFNGRIFMHHLAHAYYGFWASGLDSALVMSHDGGHTETWDGGGYFWCSREHGVMPLIPGGFWMGHFYGRVAGVMGLDAGKLMGLAPYGQPKYFTEQLVGNIGDVESLLAVEHSALAHAFIGTVCDVEKIDALPAWDAYAERPPQILADVAASAQKIFEASVAIYVKTGLALVDAIERKIDGIVLVGGAALNCPANTMLYGGYDLRLAVPPACNDEGLAIGNAVGAFFKAYGHFPPCPTDDYEKVYLGDEYSDDELSRAVAGLEKVADYSPAHTAKLLAEGAIIGLFHGRSEIGPRALGHRSILASPLIGTNWQKVNEVKSREKWRPFAPICLEEDMAEHFTGSDMKSRYMLFTHQVRHDKLPAITHVDKSARAQAATPSCGLVYDILTAFKVLTGYGVLMNTSFNGKSVPIVETPSDAVQEAQRIGLNYFVCKTGIYRTR